MKLCFLFLLILSLCSCLTLREDSEVSFKKDRPLKRLTSQAPNYPPEAAMKNQSGYVKLLVDINKKGKTYNIRVVEAKPKGVFNAAAKKAVRTYTYLAPIRDGKLEVFKNHKIELSFKTGEDL